MKSFATSILIAAPRSTVWSALTDAAAYPSWNSTVERIEGRIAGGERIVVHAKPPAGRAFPVTVAEFEPERRMVWVGGMPLGLFTGRREFTLSPNGTGVEFDMRENFTGLMSPLIARSIPDLQPLFDRFAADLKRHAEQHWA